jgi:hypothetical protein
MNKTGCAVLCLLVLLLSACTTPRFSEPPRSAIEQLLLSTAVDEALDEVKLPEVKGKRVFLSEEYLEAYDGQYIIGTIRAILSENGAYLVDIRDDAELIVEARSGALGIDSSASIFGLPGFPIYIPGAGTLELPELALYKSDKAHSVAKIALLAYRTDGKPVFSSEAFVGKSHFKHYKFLLVLNLNFTDIPERADY